MLRLRFQKTGNAVWISHLDLMRVFQRAFKRAGLPLTHTQGYNPRPSVSIALPLSVGIESYCELLDFELDGLQISHREILERLNCSLIAGVQVTDVYENGKKLKELQYLQCKVELQYDNGVPADAVKKIQALFARDALVVSKKSKNGIQEQDIIPMIRSVTVFEVEDTIVFDTVICCQNPSLNPMQLSAAVKTYLPDCIPDHTVCQRIQVLDGLGNAFR